MAVVEPHCRQEARRKRAEGWKEKRRKKKEIGTGWPPVADRPSDLWRQYLPPERQERATSLASYVSELNVCPAERAFS